MSDLELLIDDGVDAGLVRFLDDRTHLRAEHAFGDGSTQQVVEAGHRLHDLRAVGFVGQALVALQERNDLLLGPQKFGRVDAVDLAIHRVLKQDRAKDAVAAEARALDDASSHLVDLREHLVVAGVAVGFDAIRRERLGRGTTALVEGGDESIGALDLLQLLFVHGDLVTVGGWRDCRWASDGWDSSRRSSPGPCSRRRNKPYSREYPAPLGATTAFALASPAPDCPTRLIGSTYGQSDRSHRCGQIEASPALPRLPPANPARILEFTMATSTKTVRSRTAHRAKPSEPEAPADDVQIRTLPSSTELASFSISVSQATGPATSMPVSWSSPAPKVLDRLETGTEVLAIGRVVRRFYRAGGSTQSRTELVVDRIERLSRRAACRRMVEQVIGHLEATVAERLV